MSVGTGIAVAGVWAFAGICALSPGITGGALVVAVIISCVFTAGALRG